MIKTILSFVPLPWVLGAIALFGVFAVAYVKLRDHKIFQSGYSHAITEVNSANAEAAEEARGAVSKSRACRDRGGDWDAAVRPHGLCRIDEEIRNRRGVLQGTP